MQYLTYCSLFSTQGGVSSVYSKYGCRDVSFLGVLGSEGGLVPLAQPLLLCSCPILCNESYFYKYATNHHHFDLVYLCSSLER